MSDLVLVIGGTGRLGAAIQERLAAAGHSCWAPAHDSRVDITSPGLLKQLFRMQPAVSAVINTAAYHDTKLCEKNPRLAFEINGTAVGNLAREAWQKSVPFIHISTDYVFGGIQAARYVESDPPAPVNVYGASKLAGEYLTMINNPGASVVRVASLFGSPPGRSDFVKMVRQRVADNKPMEVVDDIMMTPTYTRDAASVIVNDILGRSLSGVHHVVNSGDGTSWYELAKTVATVCGAESEFVTPISASVSNDPVPRPKVSTLGCSEFFLPHWRESLRSYLALLDSQQPT